MFFNKIRKGELEVEDDDRSLQFFEQFLDHAEEAVNKIDTRIKSIDARYDELIKFLGDNPKDVPLNVFIDIFVKFQKDFAVRINYLTGIVG